MSDLFQPPVKHPWMDDAACISVDPETFFPVDTTHKKGRHEQAVADAKAICYRCKVRTECLEWAVEWLPSDGIFAGMEAREVRNHRRNLAYQAKKHAQNGAE